MYYAIRQVLVVISALSVIHQIRAQLTTVEKLYENHKIHQRDHEEMITVLREILMKQENTNSILQMQLAGEPVAEEVMRAAQTVCGSIIPFFNRCVTYLVGVT